MEARKPVRDSKRPTPVEGPDITVPVSTTFGLDVNMQVPAYSAPSEYVPDVDRGYHFDRATTLSILAGFAYDRRVLVHGYHGTGKSSHIEQVAARLNWPCLRINLDSQISRGDLVGQMATAMRDGQAVTEFAEGILSWAVQHPAAVIFDEYDAGRPDVMFVIQRLLEMDGQLALPDQNRSLAPHAGFRLFATANTVGLGDPTGLYAGTQKLNQAQMDRWSVVAQLNYLEREAERHIVLGKLSSYDTPEGRAVLDAMLACAQRTREVFVAGEIATVMSPRTVLTWAQNLEIFDDLGFAFHVTYLNKCDDKDKPVIADIYAQTMGMPLESGAARATLL